MILDIIANIGQAALKFFAATGRIALFTIQAVRWTILPPIISGSLCGN